MYAKDDLDLFMSMLSSSKARSIKKLIKSGISNISYEDTAQKNLKNLFDSLPGKNAQETIWSFFYFYANDYSDLKWYVFLFETPLEDIPLYINDSRALVALTSKWRLQIGK